MDEFHHINSDSSFTHQLNVNDPSVRALIAENTVDILAKLRDETGLTTALAILADNKRKGIVLASLPGKNDHCYVPRPGFHFHLHCTAPGKALLAALPRNKWSAILAELTYTSFTAHTYNKAEALNSALTQYARQGYATDLGEYVEGVNCVAACTPRREGDVMAAIWITALSIDLPEAQIGKFADKVIATSKEMGKRLRNLAEDPATQLNSMVNHAKHFIELNFLDEKSIRDYIQNLGCGEKWFRLSFVARFGISPLKFRQRLVLERAQRLLKNTCLSIKEIAFQLGYENQNYFSRVFKIHSGFSPEAYREKEGGAKFLRNKSPSE